MSDAPTVSVVMTVYNGAGSLAAAIDSLRQQTFTDFETIVIDDGSRDQTWSILNRLDLSRLRVHRNLKHRGQTAALNQALSLAQGRYIVLHDAHAVSHPARLARQVRFLDRHAAVAVVGCQVDWVDGAGQLIRRFDYPTGHDEIVSRLKQDNSLSHGSVMMRRKALFDISCYREPFRLAQDYDLWLRIAEVAKVANLPDTLYTMRFSARMAAVARDAEQTAYADLARQLAAERATHGWEQTDLASAAAAIERAYSKRHTLVRRIQRARNYLIWAQRLLQWGPPADRYAWAVWSYAVTTWPLDIAIWQHAIRELRNRREKE